MIFKKLLGATLLLTALAGEASAQKANAPLSRNAIFDYAGVLKKTEEDSLSYFIRKLESDIGSQIAIVTLDSLKGATIERFSLTFANKIGLGRSGYNDGLLITTAMADHQVRIEVGTGLEGIIKDEIAARIIREVITPRFRDRKFYAAYKYAILKISALIKENEALVGQ